MELFLSRGLMDSQLERSVEIHRGRRDAAADALTEHCEPWVTFDLPDGGFFLWLSLNEGVDWDAVSAEVAAHGVAIRPGEQLMDRNCVESGPPFMRLAFSHAPEHEIERGIACLGQALARA